MLDASNLSRAGSDDPLNNPGLWTPHMPRPSFDVDGYQERIDRVVGKFRDLSILKLVWMPEVFKWRPHPIHEPPPGYDLPVYLACWDAEGREIAAPRWAVMELDTPEHYRGAWNNNRWLTVKGQFCDVKGPCPDIRYTPLWRVLWHDSKCCELLGDTCWGYYEEPNEELLARIEGAAKQAKADPDVQPTCDPSQFVAPNGQREARDDVELRQRRQDEMLAEILIDAEERRMKQTSYSIPGVGAMTLRPSGLLVKEN